MVRARSDTEGLRWMEMDDGSESVREEMGRRISLDWGLGCIRAWVGWRRVGEGGTGVVGGWGRGGREAVVSIF